MSQAKLIAEELGISELTAYILIRRGYFEVIDAAKFLGLAPPDRLDSLSIYGVKDATERIIRAIDTNEKIVIYGDYDVDGVTGGSLFQEYISRHTENVSYYIPCRVEDGYGLNKNSVRTLANDGASLIVTVDNGIGCWAEVELAKELGVDVIITDHHDLPPKLPDTIVVNPKINKQLPEMAGVGVAFLVCSAIEKFRPTHGLIDLLDLVAIGTIADVAPLVGVNRPLVKAGLKVASAKKRIGLKALIERNDIPIKDGNLMKAGDVGFKIGPCLNAAGRLDRADAGVKLLMAKDSIEAAQYAAHLMEINEKRKDVTTEVTQMVENFIIEKKLDITQAIVYYAEEAHHGVLGIAAARIAEKYNVPALILGKKDGNYVGSCRAPAGFNLFDAINDLKEQGIISGGGGHAAAAGVSVPIGLIEQFQPAISRSLFGAYDNTKSEPRIPRLDAEVILEAITEQFIYELDQFQPTGAGNPEVHLLTQDITILNPKKLKNDVGLSMSITDGKREFRCVGFRMAHEFANIKHGDKVGIIYTPELSYFPPGKPPSIQFRLKKILY